MKTTLIGIIFISLFSLNAFAEGQKRSSSETYCTQNVMGIVQLVGRVDQYSVFSSKFDANLLKLRQAQFTNMAKHAQAAKKSGKNGVDMLSAPLAKMIKSHSGGKKFMKDCEVRMQTILDRCAKSESNDDHSDCINEDKTYGKDISKLLCKHTSSTYVCRLAKHQ